MRNAQAVAAMDTIDDKALKALHQPQRGGKNLHAMSKHPCRFRLPHLLKTRHLYPPGYHVLNAKVGACTVWLKTVGFCDLPRSVEGWPASPLYRTITI